MEQIKPIEMATYKKSIEKSIINLVFATTLLSKCLIFYSIAEEFDYDSDHQSILSQWTCQTVDKPQEFWLLLPKVDNLE